MAQPKLPRCRRKPPAPVVRTMDLLGVGKDGGLYLWQAESQVLPVSSFESRGKGIVTGKYVLEVRGSAVTVHCSNMANGTVGLQFMGGGLETIQLIRKAVEPMLLGKVIPNLAKEAEILRLLDELNKDLDAKNSAPHLRRGRL